MSPNLPTATALIAALILLPACGSAPRHTEADRPVEPKASMPAGNPPAPSISTIARPLPLIGLSREGRPLTASTMGSGPLRIYLVGGIHGDEPEGRIGLPLLRQSLSASGSDGRSLADRITLRLLDDMNPDGTYAGTRTNAAGIDLNRNWPAANFRAAPMSGGVVRGSGPVPLSEPESAAAHADILAFAPDVILVLHSSPRGPFINFDGPPIATQLAATFVGAATETETAWRVVPDMGYPTPGSMGSFFGTDRAVPILTVEFKRGAAPGTGPAAPVLARGVVAVTSAMESVNAPVTSAAASANSTRPGSAPAPARSAGSAPRAWAPAGPPSSSLTDRP